MGVFLSLKGDFSLKGLATAEDTYSVGAGEGRGQLDVAFYIYKGREDYIVILVQELDGGAEGVGAGSQRMAIEIEDGHRDGGARVFTIAIIWFDSWLNNNVL